MCQWHNDGVAAASINGEPPLVWAPMGKKSFCESEGARPEKVMGEAGWSS